jgi:hypothetical protein
VKFSLDNGTRYVHMGGAIQWFSSEGLDSGSGEVFLVLKRHV